MEETTDLFVGIKKIQTRIQIKHQLFTAFLNYNKIVQLWEAKTDTFIIIK